MISIQDIVQSITNQNDNQTNQANQANKNNQSKGKKIALVLDVSGSTGTQFKKGISVLEKEIECMSTFILDNKENTYELYSFES